MQTFSTSRIACFFSCPRKYFLHYVVGRLPLGEAAALSIGKAWHGAMERWWMEGLDAAITWLNSNAQDIDIFDCAKLAVLLEFYNPPRPGPILAVEEPFVMKLRDPYTRRTMRGVRICGIVDGLFEDSILEHKTTSEDIEGFPRYWARLIIDPQISNYCLAHGRTKVWYDVVRKIQLRPSKGDEQAASGRGITVVDAFMERCRKEVSENLAKYYQFRAVTRTPDELADAQQNLCQQVEMIRSCHRAGTFPKNADACRGLYGYCEYTEVCAGSADIMDDTLFKDYIERNLDEPTV